MDMGFLDKASNLTPFLVRLYDSQKLYELARDKKPAARAMLGDAVCELLEIKLSEKEKVLVAEVLIELIRQAGRDLRAALSERLSVMDDVPLRVILHLANDDIDIATPVLKDSPVLGDMDLIYILKSKDIEYWRVIAAREKMGRRVIDMLAESEDFETAITLLENKQITLGEKALTALSDLSRGHKDLAAPLLRREEVTAEIAAALYEFVGRGLKDYILERYPVEHRVLAEAVDDIVEELEGAAAGADIMPTGAMIKSAEHFQSRGKLTPKLMLNTLRRKQFQPFVAQFSVFTGLSPDIIGELLLQTSGQGLAIACKAYDIEKSDFMSIYFLTHDLRRAGHNMDIKDMNKAVGYFTRIDPAIASDIMRNSVA